MLISIRVFAPLFACLCLLSPACTSSEAQEQPAQLSDTLTQVVEQMEAPLDTVPVTYLLGKFDPADDTAFVKLQDIHTAGNARGKYLRKETYDAFKAMYDAAKADGVSLIIKSATRPFYYQRGIWNAKWNGARLVEGKNLAKTVSDPAERASLILRYSSMPGTSRHHWGTDFDLNAFTNGYFASGKGLVEFTWLEEHAASFGFCRPYTPKGVARPFGYEEEKWHWSYQPLADQYLRSYQALITPDMIKGFDGDEVVKELKVIERYVMGISTVCKE